MHRCTGDGDREVLKGTTEARAGDGDREGREQPCIEGWFEVGTSWTTPSRIVYADQSRYHGMFSEILLCIVLLFSDQLAGRRFVHQRTYTLS